MKRNLLLGIAIIGAVALSSCSVNKTASTAKNSDDVYFSQATAGEAPEYIAPKPVYQQQDDVADNGDGGDDDYYYYDDYSSRINRFGYYSPFSYYDSYYGNYNPYNYSNYSFAIGINWSPFTLPYGYYGGIGYGYGAFSPYAGFGYGYGYGYGGYYGGYGYSPYSYWGTGYGYGGPYWGVISANSTYGTPRPNRGTGSPRGIGASGRNGIGYSGVANNGIGYYPNRPTRGANGGYTRTANGNNNGGYSTTRPTRAARSGGNDSYQPQQRPASTARTPDRQPSYSPPAPSSSSSSGGGGGGSSSGGGGGGRPARP